MPLVVGAFGVLLTILLWRAARARPSFVVVFSEGELKVRGSKVSRKFQRECREILMENGIESARIEGVLSGDDRVTLQFSESIPANIRQRIRNVRNLG